MPTLGYLLPNYSLYMAPVLLGGVGNRTSNRSNIVRSQASTVKDVTLEWRSVKWPPSEHLRRGQAAYLPWT